MTDHERRYTAPIIRDELARVGARCTCEGQHRDTEGCELARETDRARRLALLDYRNHYN